MFEQIKVPSLRLTHSSEGMRKLKVCGWNRRRLTGAGAKVQPQGDAFDLATIPKADAGSRGQTPDRRANHLRGITAYAVFLIVG